MNTVTGHLIFGLMLICMAVGAKQCYDDGIRREYREEINEDTKKMIDERDAERAERAEDFVEDKEERDRKMQKTIDIKEKARLYKESWGR